MDAGLNNYLNHENVEEAVFNGSLFCILMEPNEKYITSLVIIYDSHCDFAGAKTGAETSSVKVQVNSMIPFC